MGRRLGISLHEWNRLGNRRLDRGALGRNNGGKRRTERTRAFFSLVLRIFRFQDASFPHQDDREYPGAGGSADFPLGYYARGGRS